MYFVCNIYYLRLIYTLDKDVFYGNLMLIWTAIISFGFRLWFFGLWFFGLWFGLWFFLSTFWLRFLPSIRIRSRSLWSAVVGVNHRWRCFHNLPRYWCLPRPAGCRSTVPTVLGVPRHPLSARAVKYGFHVSTRFMIIRHHRVAALVK